MLECAPNFRCCLLVGLLLCLFYRRVSPNAKFFAVQLRSKSAGFGPFAKLTRKIILISSRTRETFPGAERTRQRDSVESCGARAHTRAHTLLYRPLKIEKSTNVIHRVEFKGVYIQFSRTAPGLEMFFRYYNGLCVCH